MAASSTLLLVSAGLSALGSISEGESASDQAKFQSTVTIQQAGSERKVAREEERDFRRRQSRTLAERRAALGASGAELGTGTALLATADFEAETELQARRIRAGGETRATRLEQEATLQRRAGRNARRRGLFRAGASLLGGFGDAFG